jgi:Bacterial Ig-like domain
MLTIDYIVRDEAGVTSEGASTEIGSETSVYVAGSKDVSLNISAGDVLAYVRVGSDLQLVMADGSTVSLDGFYDSAVPYKRLFLSEDGELSVVVLPETAVDGALAAEYAYVDTTGKWSAYDSLVFLDIEQVEPVVAPIIAGAGLFGGAGAAAAGGAVLIGAGGGGGGGGGGNDGPSVDGGSILVAGPEAERAALTVTGEAEAGSSVEVTVGTAVVTVVADSDGNWSATVPPADLPADDEYVAAVVVTEPGGDVFTLSGPTVLIDTTAPDLAVTAGLDSVDHVVNAEDMADGTEVSGTGEAGASVSVEIQGVTQSTTVGADGQWSVNFAAGTLTSGEYSAAVTMVTSDIYGNEQTFTDTIVVDTEAAAVRFDTVAEDDVINLTESAAGVAISGTSEAGASLALEIAGNTYTTVVDGGGNWSVTVPAGTLVAGTYETNIVATVTDAAGNSAAYTKSVTVDTESSLSVDLIEGDNVVSAAEEANGITVTGQAEAGSDIVVLLEGDVINTQADSSGNWSVAFDPGLVPTSPHGAQPDVQVIATDTAGNETIEFVQLTIDTYVNGLTSDGPTEGPVISEAERGDGITLEGTTEANAEVSIEIDGVTRTGTADGDGNWSVDFESGTIAAGEYTATATITATDAVGNTREITDTFTVDTVAAPVITAQTISNEGAVTALQTTDMSDPAILYEISGDDPASNLNATVTDLPSGQYYGFDPVSDGSSIVVAAADSEGNSADTLVVLDQNGPAIVDLTVSGLANFDIEAVNLDFADDSQLTITADMLNDLSDSSNNLHIQGGTDDTVTAIGAVATGETENIAGNTFAVYTLGDEGGRLIIDDDISVVI